MQWGVRCVIIVYRLQGEICKRMRQHGKERFRETMKKRRLGRAVITSLLVSSLCVVPVFAEPSVDDLEQSKQAAQNEVTSLQEELQGLVEKINELEQNLITKGEEISQAEEDLAAAEEKEKQQYEDMKLRIKYMYENGETSALETLLSSTDFSDLLNKAEYVQNVHKYDRDKLEEYVATKQEIADLKDTLETEMANMESLQAEYSSQEESLNATLTAKQDEVANLDEQLQAAVEAAAQKAAEEAAAQAASEQASAQDEAGTSAGGGSGSTGGDTTTGGGTSTGGGSSSSGGGNYQGSGDSSVGSAIVSAAASYLGVPYVWGGTSYSGVDCSGLVYLAHQAVGISVARQSGSLGAGGKAVSASEAMPGDVVCYAGHVGIYVGGGQMIHAPQPGQVVCYTSVNYASHWFRRYW